ncbi:hypothetical protein M422DRAFT_241541 [Sphaerobolus stellatus SS14]|nr:hypothetical protein M422DRAFT_241541 [Sphaerobolus stellatus SS14]
MSTAPTDVKAAYNIPQSITILLDPRRWVGAVIAFVGIVLSALTPLLPTYLSDHILHVNKNTITVPELHSVRPSHHRHSHRKSHAHHSVDAPQPHVTSPESHERWSISGSSAGLSSNASSNTSLPKVESTTSMPTQLSTTNRCFSSPSRGDPSRPCPIEFIKDTSRRCLDSLDLATPSSASPESFMASAPTSHATQNPRRPFRVKMPFSAKRRSITESLGREDSFGSAVDSITGSTAEGLSAQHPVIAFEPDHIGVKRSSTAPPSTPGSANAPFSPRTCLSLTPVDLIADQFRFINEFLPYIDRRKFSLFGRNPPTYLVTSSDVESVEPVAGPSNMSSPRSILSSPPLSLSSFDDIPFSPLPSALLTSSSGSTSTSMTSPSSSIFYPAPLRRSKTANPPRPQRTDPYKKYGLPVPGSEQAKAYIKADKEWLKTEKERRERLRKEREQEEMERVRKAAAEEAVKATMRQLEGKASSKKKGNPLCPKDRRMRRLSKGKDKEYSSSVPSSPHPSPSPSHLNLHYDYDPGVDADGEDDARSHDTHDAHGGHGTMDEFGTLLPAVQEEKEGDTASALSLSLGPTNSNTSPRAKSLPRPRTAPHASSPPTRTASSGNGRKGFFSRRHSSEIPVVPPLKEDNKKQEKEKREGKKLSFLNMSGPRGRGREKDEKGHDHFTLVVIWSFALVSSFILAILILILYLSTLHTFESRLSLHLRIIQPLHFPPSSSFTIFQLIHVLHTTITIIILRIVPTSTFNLIRLSLSTFY